MIDVDVISLSLSLSHTHTHTHYLCHANTGEGIVSLTNSRFRLSKKLSLFENLCKATPKLHAVVLRFTNKRALVEDQTSSVLMCALETFCDRLDMRSTDLNERVEIFGRGLRALQNAHASVLKMREKIESLKPLYAAKVSQVIKEIIYLQCNKFNFVFAIPQIFAISLFLSFFSQLIN